MQAEKKDKTEKTEINGKFAKRLLSLFIALITVIGCVPFLAMPVWAADEEDEIAKAEKERINLFLTTVYENPDEKLKDFGAKTVEVVKGTGRNAVTSYVPDGKPVLVKDGFELYYQYDTGEIAIKDTRTGQIMFSNPYDIGPATAASSESIKYEVMSQVIIKYGEADKKYFFNTFKDAALFRQIKMKKIKGGIRVEYTIGKEEKRKLVPRCIERSSFEDNILQHITNQRDLDKMNAYYTLKDANASDLTERAKKELQVTYPITKFYAIYVFDPNASERELNQIEGFIKLYTKYSFEMMDEDHNLVEYEPKDKAPPLFKMALEYYIDPDGLYMRLPANGIRFDESTYKIEYIHVLPYMGAGRKGNTGYTFIPDGSGALMRYEDIRSEPLILTNKLYGPDFSFYNIGGGNHTRKWRIPVFGAVENYEIRRETKVEEIEAYYDETGARVETPVKVPVIKTDENGDEFEELEDAFYDSEGNEVTSPVKIFVDGDGNEYDERPKVDIEERSDGFLAIIEEGDVMATVTTQAGGSTNQYYMASTQFTPRPTDEYNLDFETKGINSLILVASRRKYAGNYIIRYIMLSSDENGSPKNKNGGYEASYVGMAKAYRDYLIRKGELTPLADDGGDIPLFIESFGTIKTAEYFIGFPYEGTTPLTTFEDVKSMIDELNGEIYKCDACNTLHLAARDEVNGNKTCADDKCDGKLFLVSGGISNLKFRLNGWMNGGMHGTVPTNVKIEKKMGGVKGFQDMVDYAKQKNAGIYPDMDFALAWRWKLLDGFSPKKDLVRFMDQIYARTQSYWFLAQNFMFRMYYNLIDHERAHLIYDRAMKKYMDYDVEGLSVVSLARELHSNHYKKNLSNRMDARGQVTALFEKMVDDHGNLLADEANAYAFRYLDSIINVDLDNSRFALQSEGVPFYGMVTHGYINIAGAPINMSGDYKYDLLKAIENGASPYFIVSYQNTNRLKEATLWSLNSYYSVNYHTWLNDMIETYHRLNDALKPVKTKPIIGHEFLGRNIVKVTYEGGTSFILNYFHEDEVTVTDGGREYTVPPLDFIKIN